MFVSFTSHVQGCRSLPQHVHNESERAYTFLACLSRMGIEHALPFKTEHTARGGGGRWRCPSKIFFGLSHYYRTAPVVDGVSRSCASCVKLWPVADDGECMVA